MIHVAKFPENLDSDSSLLVLFSCRHAKTFRQTRVCSAQLNSAQLKPEHYLVIVVSFSYDIVIVCIVYFYYYFYYFANIILSAMS